MALSSEHRLAFANGELPTAVDRQALRRVPRAFAFQYDVLAFAHDATTVSVAMADPEDDEVLDRLTNITGARIRCVTLPRELIRARLAAAYDSDESSGNERGDAPPAIRAVDDIHEAAVRAGASDIHIEPTSDGGRTRFRIDGLLRQTHTVPTELFAQIVSRVKLLAGMDIADRRQPQDGRYHVEISGRSIDARVSSMPTISGEKLVIRLLDMRARVPSLERLGIPSQILERYRQALHAPHGFIVVCGPTGSGKTTTLYASLAERNTEGQHICTVEDPVEIRMAGVAQVHVNVRAGLTFAAALRSFLRQDPNVIMVGEMRDSETASVAMSAALSGQLVVTSLHANDAPRTVERLVELGLARHALAAGLTGVLAQRLVRELCSSCRQRRADGSYDATGCDGCGGSGYRGRTAICEYFPVTADVRTAIAAGASSVELAELGRAAGYEPMIDDGLRRIDRGETSLYELRRVLALEHV